MGLLTTTEPLPQYVGANDGNFTCNKETGNLMKTDTERLVVLFLVVRKIHCAKAKIDKHGCSNV